MKQEYFISVYLDTRRVKANRLFPVKLRVYTSSPRKQKLYPTKFEFSEAEFNSIWNTIKTRNEHKQIRKELKAIEDKANEIAKEINPFTFEQFERHLYRKKGEGIKVAYHYKQTIEDLLKHNQLGTASTYDLSQKSISKFTENQLDKKYTNLTLFDITSNWLKEYEYYMTEIKGRSLTTVSMYLRALRALFNNAIAEKEIGDETYPFGKRKYQVPATKNTKKALSKEQLHLLFNSEPEKPEQIKAKDFWFFSYACNGMNIKDIALLRYKDIQEGKIEFYRAKTLITSKSNLKPITAYLNDFTTEIIEKYGNENKDHETFVFNILHEGLTPQQQQQKIKNFTRFINQNLKKLCKAIELPVNISTYWARHSFATNAVRKGATLEFVQESLGHGDLKTTQNYFAGFDSDTKKEFAESIMDFD